MLKLVTTNNPEVFRHLGSTGFQRIGATFTVAKSYDETLAAVRDHRPDVALIDLEVAGGSGVALCQAIKADPAMSGTHVILLISSVIRKADLEFIQSGGADDLLALPIHFDDFYQHIAHIAGLPYRRDLRVAVKLEMSGDHTLLAGKVINVGSGGIGISVPKPLTVGQQLSLRLRHNDIEFPDTLATVAWLREGKPGQEHLAGLAFIGEVPIKTRLLIEELSLFDVAPMEQLDTAAPAVTVALQGTFTEITDLAPLTRRLEREPRIDFDASAVRYISSAGVRAWCIFLESLADKTYTFRRCSMAFTSQAAMVPMVIGTGKVLSVEAPYVCEACDREELRLIETQTLIRDGGAILAPRLHCVSCGGDLVFDDVPERYFAFLNND